MLWKCQETHTINYSFIEIKVFKPSSITWTHWWELQKKVLYLEFTNLCQHNNKSIPNPMKDNLAINAYNSSENMPANLKDLCISIMALHTDICA